MDAPVRIIFNADDFGLTRSISDAVEMAHRGGVLTSATLLSNAPAAAYAASIAQRNPGLSVGLHFQLVAGVPATPDLKRVGTLVGPDGRFPENYIQFFKYYHAGRIDRREIFTELVSQAKKALSLGVKPTHADSHQHIHMHPSLFPVFAEAAREAGIKRFRDPVEPYCPSVHGRFEPTAGNVVKACFMNPLYKRWFSGRLKKRGLSSPAIFFGQYFSGRMTLERILAFIGYIRKTYNVNSQYIRTGGVFVEIMTHPGLSAAEYESIPGCDAEFRKYSWRGEYEALVSRRLKDSFDGSALGLAGYSDL